MTDDKWQAFAEALEETPIFVIWGAFVICHSDELQASSGVYTKVYWIVAALLSVSCVANPKLISIVDDDESVREGLRRLLAPPGSS